MSKDSKNKKLIIGSALAGLIIAGPGLSLTASPTSTKFFSTAQLTVGYRQAQAADAAASPAPKTKETKKEAKEEKKEAADKNCGPDGKCGKEKHCGKDSKDKHCCAKDDTKCDANKHCAPKTDMKGNVKTDMDKSCGQGSCGK